MVLNNLLLFGYVSLCASIIILFSLCKKSIPTPPDRVTVYVAGVEDNKAVVWKNGVMQPLKVMKGTTISQALGITIAGSDMYVVGIQLVQTVL